MFQSHLSRVNEDIFDKIVAFFISHLSYLLICVRNLKRRLF